MNNDLSWSNNTDFIIFKLNSRLYCLRKLKKHNVDTCIFKAFLSVGYQVFICFVGLEMSQNGT